MATFDHDSAPASFEWNLQWKNNLSNLIAKLKEFFEDAEIPVLTVTDGLVVEGDVLVEGSLEVEGDLAAEDAAIAGELTVGEDIWVEGDVNGTRIGAPINITTYSVDYPLSVGEVVKVNVTAASTPLNVSVSDGIYDIICDFDETTFAATQVITLEINNTTYSSTFNTTRFAASTVFATDEVDTTDGSQDSHQMSASDGGAADLSPYMIHSRLVITGNRSTLFSTSYGTTAAAGAGTNIVGKICSRRNASPAHTSLGTLNAGEVATGVVYIHRLA